MRPLEDAAHARRIIEQGGIAALGERVLRRALARVAPPSLGVDVRPEDLVGRIEPERRREVGRRPEVVMVMTPPSGRSGGHMTLMRVVERLEKSGFGVTIALYDVYGGSLARHAPTVRALFPTVEATLVDATAGIPDADAVIATSWQSAHVVARSPSTGRRFYLVQDFEPWFYARGDSAELAEQTYRLGFHGIAIGGWLASRLQSDFGMECDSFPFGCDPDPFRITATSQRDGVVFYARPSTPRRGFALGMLALEIVHRTRPGLRIHLFGERTGWDRFPVEDHGTLSIPDLARVYSTCIAGLSLSFTNVSLAPWEMLAAGCIPVVNDSPFARADLASPYVRFSAPTPQDLAAAILEQEAVDSHSRGLAVDSIRGIPWDASTDRVVEVVTRQVGRPR